MSKKNNGRTIYSVEDVHNLVEERGGYVASQRHGTYGARGAFTDLFLVLDGKVALLSVNRTRVPRSRLNTTPFVPEASLLRAFSDLERWAFPQPEKQPRPKPLLEPDTLLSQKTVERMIRDAGGLCALRVKKGKKSPAVLLHYTIVNPDRPDEPVHVTFARSKNTIGRPNISRVPCVPLHQLNNALQSAGLNLQ